MPRIHTVYFISHNSLIKADTSTKLCRLQETVKIVIGLLGLVCVSVSDAGHNNSD